MPFALGPMVSNGEDPQKTKWKELTYDQRIKILMDVINQIYNTNIVLREQVDKLLVHKHIDEGFPVNIESMSHGREATSIYDTPKRLYSPFDQFDFSED